MKFKVYFADIHGEDIGIEESILSGIAEVWKGERCKEPEKDEERLLEVVEDLDALGVRHTRITKKIIDKMKKCRIIARFGGGYDNIDVKYATEKGIIVTFVPDYCTEAVAEHALTLALMKIRNIKKYEERIENNYWSAQGIKAEMSKDTVLGIIGLGRIGGTLSRKASCVGFNVIAFDPFISNEDFKNKKAEKADKLDDLLKTADIISLNVPLTREGEYPTFRMLGKKEIEKMKEGVYIINVCRGEVIDTDALIDSIKSGKVSGLATDLIEGEPVQNTYIKEGENSVYDRLKSLPQVMITPHCAFASTRSIRTVKEKGAMEIKRVLEGGFPRRIAWINPEVEKKYSERFKI